MSSQQAQPEYGAFGRRIEKLGMPRPLFWGFVAVFIFMIGDGVEISRLPGYLANQGGLNGAQASLITGTVYGLAVLIASWLSGTLSSIWGPQRVMQLALRSHNLRYKGSRISALRLRVPGLDPDGRQGGA